MLVSYATHSEYERFKKSASKYMLRCCVLAKIICYLLDCSYKLLTIVFLRKVRYGHKFLAESNCLWEYIL